MKPAEILSVLQTFHREKLTLRQRHVAVARHVGNYAFNNTYQYVIAREDMHLSWLEAAITELQGTPEQLPEPNQRVGARGHGRSHSSRKPAPSPAGVPT